jgi:small subunit ribosomal protein S8
MTDPIADLLIRIKNAHMARQQQLLVPFSKVKKNIAEILQQEGYLESVGVTDITTANPFMQIEIKLRYVGKLPAVTDVKRLSKPGRRLYAPAKDIPRALGGYGVTIVSTSKGIMTDKQARKQNIGGELICQVW